MHNPPDNPVCENAKNKTRPYNLLMRIIGGEYAGRRLKSFKGRDIRPTPDRVREAVFASLGERVRGARVLDLFAGTGALGLEALSRGARETVFVETSAQAADLIRENLNLIGKTGQARVLRSDAQAAVRGRLKGAFDLIFADPPYRIDIKYLHGIFLTIQGNGLLEPDGVLVLEGPARREPIAPERDFMLLKRKVYGDTCMEFYELKPSEETEGERPSEK